MWGYFKAKGKPSGTAPELKRVNHTASRSTQTTTTHINPHSSTMDLLFHHPPKASSSQPARSSPSSSASPPVLSQPASTGQPDSAELVMRMRKGLERLLERGGINARACRQGEVVPRVRSRYPLVPQPKLTEISHRLERALAAASPRSSVVKSSRVRVAAGQDCRVTTQSTFGEGQFATAALGSARPTS